MDFCGLRKFCQVTDQFLLMNNLSEFIKSQAQNLGFDLVGIAPAQPLEAESLRLREWINRGYHATMKWMENRMEEREDVRNYFSEAKSIVSVAINYFHGTANTNLKISNYAWGDDYHDVVKRKLRKLVPNIQKVKPEVRGLVCVDTSPVLEKAWAQRAGLGWLGKHTNLITRDYGSWLFLGELILDIELDYDLPFDEDMCGTCTACIDACPTSALSDYVLDARSCISYHTIENRGELPDEFKNQLNGWIFGCDICQEVCPWNKRFAKQSQKGEFLPRVEIVEKTKEGWQELTLEEYRRIFWKSTIKRVKFEELMRNIYANS